MSREGEGATVLLTSLGVHRTPRREEARIRGIPRTRASHQELRPVTAEGPTRS